MAAKMRPSRLMEALLQTGEDMRRAGVLDAVAHEKFTLRHLGDGAAAVAEPISGE